MSVRRAIVWFRQDLRLHDNEALQEALKSAEEVIPAYVFDERVFKGQTRFGFPKTGRYRARFVLESVLDLRQSLREKGSDLVIRFGKPEEELFLLARQVKSSWIFCNRERTQEEVEVQDQLEKKLWSVGQEMRYSRGKMLFYTADLPFPVTHTPDSFSQFRKEVERYVRIREPLPVPETLPPVSEELERGEAPSMEFLGWKDSAADDRGALIFHGGEKRALERLRYYIWESGLIAKYKETRNGLIGGDYSSKFSPWLAQGCLSPKKIYHEIKKYEAEYGANKSTYWLIFELMWRDYFRFIGKKYGTRIFLRGGVKGEANPEWKNDHRLLDLWVQGRTGVPFIDANMRELKQTGFMSNRGRQNVASFLVKDLLVNWQMGAEYFESILIDYDPCSNWGNWNYIAGVGCDPRENRYFNILSQAKRYDPKGEYVRLWIPELESLPCEKIHQPDLLSDAEQKRLQVVLGADYPRPMVSTRRWAS